MNKQNTYYEQLQGLRCIAALLVIADHCNLLGMGGHGGVAVCFFLALSGFLLVRPWESGGEERYCTAAGIGGYFRKRIVRLLPVYYFLVLLHAALSGSYENLAGDLLFTRSSGHLWYVQQYLVMLLVFPLLMILIRFLKRTCLLNDFAIAVLLLIAAYVCRRYLTAGIFYLIGNGRKQRFRIGLFLVGMSAGYLWKGKKLRASLKITGALCDLIGFAVIAAAVLSGGRLRDTFIPSFAGYEIAYAKDFECALASSALILAVLANPDGLLCRILKFPAMILVGELSYEIYLVHPMLMSFTQASTASRLFVRILLLSVCAAYGIQGFEAAVKKMLPSVPRSALRKTA